jgi:mono/diheme cytochrome c family protein
MTKSRCPRKSALALLLCMLAFSSVVFAGNPSRPAEPSAKKDATNASAVVNTYDADAMRVQGEQRFRANCGRCHAAPQKFPPRMMATVLRHMRVRATITDQDMRLVLFYMSQ